MKSNVDIVVTSKLREPKVLTEPNFTHFCHIFELNTIKPADFVV